MQGRQNTLGNRTVNRELDQSMGLRQTPNHRLPLAHRKLSLLFPNIQRPQHCRLKSTVNIDGLLELIAIASPKPCMNLKKTARRKNEVLHKLTLYYFTYHSHCLKAQKQ